MKTYGKPLTPAEIAETVKAIESMDDLENNKEDDKQTEGLE